MAIVTRVAVLLMMILVILYTLQAHSAITSTINECEQSVPLSSSEDGKDFITTRLCIKDVCSECYSKPESNLDETCKNYQRGMFPESDDWESYKCCSYNPDTCTNKSIKVP